MLSKTQEIHEIARPGFIFFIDVAASLLTSVKLLQDRIAST
jgi:hypothetical protein